jgi:hypothetical protein
MTVCACIAVCNSGVAIAACILATSISPRIATR